MHAQTFFFDTKYSTFLGQMTHCLDTILFCNITFFCLATSRVLTALKKKNKVAVSLLFETEGEIQQHFFFFFFFCFARIFKEALLKHAWAVWLADFEPSHEKFFDNSPLNLIPQSLPHWGPIRTRRGAYIIQPKTKEGIIKYWWIITIHVQLLQTVLCCSFFPRSLHLCCKLQAVCGY